MVDGIQGGGGGLARAAIEAALRSQSQAAAKIDAKVAESFADGGVDRAAAPASSSFGETLVQGLRDTNAGVNQIDRLPGDMVTGKIGDFHELAVRIKQAELSFKFAMEVRNKLIDAYRETMRMNV
jgi:flagellar hook-basal body complex protein FliE